MLGIRMPRFIRRFIRKHTMAMPEETAYKWKAGISVVYMLICWNIAGFVIYRAMRPKRLTDPDYVAEGEEVKIPPAAYYANLFKAENAKVIRHKGGFKFETEPIDISEVKKLQELRENQLRERQKRMPNQGKVDITKEDESMNIFNDEN